MAEAIEDTIPCEHCNSQVNLWDWAGHSRKCFHDGNNQIKKEQTDSVNDQSDNKRIPCEFCDTSISIDEWRSHSQICADRPRQRIECSRYNDDAKPTDILIPCEYCNIQVSIHELEWLTRQCATSQKRPFESSQNDESVLIPCEYCNTPVSAHEWKWHTKKCADDERQRIEEMARRISIEPSNESVPCEYCNQLYSLQKIEAHQEKCRRIQEAAVFRSDTPHDQAFGNTFPSPEYWDSSPTKNLTRYTIAVGTEEYKFVADNFHKTLPSNQIVKIERIQNRRWYRQYEAHKEDFIERYGNSTEQWLFHGCRRPESAEAIIPDCFNRSHAVNCAVGQGIYFATNAQMSHRYTHPDANRLRHMFMARVLVGRTTAGNPSTRVCPPGFDTTGGGNVFVTYHDAQAYGQYLIVYR